MMNHRPVGTDGAGRNMMQDVEPQCGELASHPCVSSHHWWIAWYVFVT